MAPQLVQSPTETVNLLGSEHNGHQYNGYSYDSDDHLPKRLLLRNPVPPRLTLRSEFYRPFSLVVSLPFTLVSFLHCWRPLLQSSASFPVSVSSHLLSLSASLPPITYLKTLDKYLWAYISFYKEVLDPALPPFLPGYLSSLATCAYIPIVESVRGRKKRNNSTIALHDERTAPKLSISNTILSKPVFVGLLSQIFGRGTIYPTWWAIFVSSGRARISPRTEESTISQIDAEGILLSMLIGFILPSLKFSSTTSQSKWILIWLLYPLTISLVRSIHGKIRRRWLSTKEDSEEWGYRIIMFTYLVGFLHASIPHIRVMLPRLLSPSRSTLISTLLSPSTPYPLAHPPPSQVTQAIYHIIQWDCIVTFVSSLIAPVVIGENAREMVGIALWNTIGMSFFGTGGALSGLWAWREWRMRRGRRDVRA